MNTHEQVLLMISTDSNILDPQSSVALRQKEYAQKYKEVHIVVLTTRKNSLAREVVLSPNCWVYSTYSLSKFLTVFNALQLSALIMKGRGVTAVTCQDPFFTGMIGVSAKKKNPAISLEIQVHTDIGSPQYTYTLGNKLRKALALSYIPKADHIRVVSNKIRDYLVSTLSIAPEKIEVRPIAVDVEKLAHAQVIEGANLHAKYPQFEKIILMASRLEPEKNIQLAINAFKLVSQKMPKVGLVIVGQGSQSSQLKVLGSNSIIFESWASPETLYSYYKTADVFLLTSLYEGYGLTLKEAQTAGCKMVSTDVGIAQEIGAAICTYDPADVADKIIHTLS